MLVEGELRRCEDFSLQLCVQYALYEQWDADPTRSVHKEGLVYSLLLTDLAKENNQ